VASVRGGGSSLSDPKSVLMVCRGSKADCERSTAGRIGELLVSDLNGFDRDPTRSRLIVYSMSGLRPGGIKGAF
jgi:hypothetical protein